jgi:hypothetical protein
MQFDDLDPSVFQNLQFKEIWKILLKLLNFCSTITFYFALVNESIVIIINNNQVRSLKIILYIIFYKDDTFIITT